MKGRLLSLLAYLYGLISDTGGEVLEWLIKITVKKENRYQSDFASPSLIMSSRSDGFCVNGKLRISKELSRQHALCISPSGGGKSTTVAYPSLMALNHSMVVHDPSGELLKVKSDLLHRGFDVHVLSVTDPDASLRYNPLSRATSTQRVRQLASILVRHHSKDPDSFWSQSAIGVIMWAIQVVKALDGDSASLGAVYRLLQLLQGQPGEIDILMAELDDKGLQRTYDSYAATSANTFSGIVATALSAMSWIGDDPEVQKILASDSLDFYAFRLRKTALFLKSSTAQLHYFAPLFSMFLSQFSEILMEDIPSDRDLDVSLILDELSSLTIPGFANLIANFRKYHVSCLGFLQDETQLTARYGKEDAHTILMNAGTKIYFGGYTSKSLSESLGRVSWEDDKGQLRDRSLMTADEIRLMPKNQGLVMSQGVPPIKVRLHPVYTQTQLMQRLNAPLPDLLPEKEKEASVLIDE